MYAEVQLSIKLHPVVTINILNNSFFLSVSWKINIHLPWLTPISLLYTLFPVHPALNLDGRQPATSCLRADMFHFSGFKEQGKAVHATL